MFPPPQRSYIPSVQVNLLLVKLSSHQHTPAIQFNAHLPHFLLSHSAGSEECSLYAASDAYTLSDGRNALKTVTCGWIDLLCLLISTAVLHRGAITKVVLTEGIQTVESAANELTLCHSDGICEGSRREFQDITFLLTSPISSPGLPAYTGRLTLTAI